MDSKYDCHIPSDRRGVDGVYADDHGCDDVHYDHSLDHRHNHNRNHNHTHNHNRDHGYDCDCACVRDGDGDAYAYAYADDNVDRHRYDDPVAG